MRSHRSLLIVACSSALLPQCAPQGSIGSAVSNSGFPVLAGSPIAQATVGLGFMASDAPMEEDASCGGVAFQPQGRPDSRAPETGPRDPARSPAAAAQSEQPSSETCEDDFVADCTGVIIGKRKILTAAHCVPEPKTREEAEKDAQEEAAGKLTPTDTPGNPKRAPDPLPQIVEKPLRWYAMFGVDPAAPVATIEITQVYTWNYVGDWVRAEGYNGASPEEAEAQTIHKRKNKVNDVAVLTLASDIPPGFTPAPLPSRADVFVPYEAYRHAWIAGFGRQGDRYYASARSKRQKKGVMNQSPTTIDRSSSSIHTALFNLENSTACHGDSGGPLFKVKNPDSNAPEIDYLLGIASWVSDPEYCLQDAFYTDVRQYLGFIADPSRYSSPVLFPTTTYAPKWPAAEASVQPQSSAAPRPSQP